MCTFYDEKSKLWGSLDQPRPNLLTNPEKSLAQAILDLLSMHDSKVAQINDDNGVQMTYHEVWLRTVRAAQNLEKQGIQPRQAFGFMTGNNDYLLPIFLASVCLACPIVPLHSMLSKEEIARILSKTKPSIIFCDANTIDQINEVLKEIKLTVKVIMFGERIDGIESVESLFVETDEEDIFVPVRIDVEMDIAGIFCSSGTTGPSKGVCVTYGHSVYIDPSKYEPNSVLLRFDSIFWTVGIKVILDCINSGATRIITAKPYSAELQFELIKKYKVNILCATSYWLPGCLKGDHRNTDLSSIRHIFAFGGKVPLSLVPEIHRYFPNASLCSSYGLTELGQVSQCVFDVQGNGRTERLVSGCTAKIVDEDGNRCGPNVNGEIRIKKNYKFHGYLDDPKASAAAVDDEGFFRSGDRGLFDVKGNLVIEDRIKDVIYCYACGFKAVILPHEIEECLISQPDIEEVCVVGIPTSSVGQLVAAVVVQKPNSSQTSRDIFNVVAENFPVRSKLRGGVYFVDTLFKTHNGKLCRGKITELATNMFRAAKDSDPIIQSYLSDIPEEIRKLLKVPILKNSLLSNRN